MSAAGRRGRWLLAAFFAVCAAQPVIAEVYYEREIQVERAGHVVVEADAALLLHGGALALELFDPDGHPAPAALWEDRSDASDCPFALLTVVEQDSEWIVLNLTPEETSGPFSEVRFRLHPTLAGLESRVEARDRFGRWRVLAEGLRFRHGPDPSASQMLLEFPSVEADVFRIYWPASAEMETPDEAELCPTRKVATLPTLPVVLAPISEFAGARRFRFLNVPWSVPVSALVAQLPMGEATPTAYRLQSAENGTWVTVAAGAWPKRATRHRIELVGYVFTEGIARLELEGAGAGEISAAWYLLGHRLHFDARSSGRYRLVYPAISREPAADDFAGIVPGDSAKLGPERPFERSTSLSADGATAPEATYALRIPVPRPELVWTGSLVAVELPAKLGQWIGDRGAGLRVLADGRQIPYELDTAPEPETVELIARRTPRRDAKGSSVLDLELEDRQNWNSMRWSRTLRLRMPAEAAPFRRDVFLQADGGISPSAHGRPSDCAAPRRTSCIQTLQVVGQVGSRARLQFRDGDSAPLSRVSVELESARPRLTFLWPEGDSVEVAAGAVGLAAPSGDNFWRRTAYDLAMAPYRIDLAERADLSTGANAPAPGEGPPSRRAVTGALFLVALALGVLALRQLPRGAEDGRR